MIFVTVGTQLPFDRLIGAATKLAARRKEPIFAQTMTQTRWPGIESTALLPEAEFDALCRQARCIVGHAGMGTYLTACRFKKPVIIMPRRKALREHRSDHQMHSAEVLMGRPGVQIVHDLEGLCDAVDKATEAAIHAPAGYESLLSALRGAADVDGRFVGILQPN